MSRHSFLPLHRPLRSALRFRRWSRKGYAALISLQHTVTIGQLAIALADRFQQKQLSLHTGLNRFGGAVGREAHDRKASSVWPWEEETEPLLWANGLLCAALPCNEEVHLATDVTLYNIGIGGRERSERIAPALFYWAKRNR